ncbi:hypothetical protein HO173_002796 [Letharia columbiana]|uniref:Uncharacterized protein n=1 Tax=Letharia columbiana TaxID=112416 RepID=A0A8H6G1Z8_9LECA|nr:uncharacterized protein HO173_002796 [Letharia columbiana]KAF6238924.1 hypothetical protein HO173_002796 [Letharia columbiana]
MPAPLSTLNTTIMIAKMALLLAKINLVPVVVVTVARLAMIRPDLLLQLSRTQQSNYRSDLTSVVGLYLSKTMIQWLISRNYLAAGAPLAGYYRILD